MLLYFWGSPDGAEQLGAVANSSGPVSQGCGKLGCLTEVMFLVVRRLVVNA